MWLLKLNCAVKYPKEITEGCLEFWWRKATSSMIGSQLLSSLILGTFSWNFGTVYVHQYCRVHVACSIIKQLAKLRLPWRLSQELGTVHLGQQRIRVWFTLEAWHYFHYPAKSIVPQLGQKPVLQICDFIPQKGSLLLPLTPTLHKKKSAC